MQHASVYLRGRRLYLTGDSETVAGFYLSCESCTVLEADSPNHALGRAVLDALATSRQGIATPDRDYYKTYVHPCLSIAGVSSWSAFARRARCVSVSRQEDLLNLVPSENKGARGGFAHLPAEQLSCPLDEEAIGAAVWKALDLCR